MQKSKKLRFVVKIDINEANKRLHTNLRNTPFEIVTWVNSNKPAKVRCKYCNTEKVFQKGKSIYTPSSSFYKNPLAYCTTCNYIEILEENLTSFLNAKEDFIKAVKNIFKYENTEFYSVKSMWDALGVNSVAKWETNLFKLCGVNYDITQKSNKKCIYIHEITKQYSEELLENAPYLKELSNKICACASKLLELQGGDKHDN